MNAPTAKELMQQVVQRSEVFPSLEHAQMDVQGNHCGTLATTSDGEDWPNPVPLPNALPPVMKFDFELLPYELRDWVSDISERMQCPPDFAAVGAVVAISSLIGARALVAPKAVDDFTAAPNLWGMIVGRPGVMKTPALSEVLKPLNRLEAEEREKWKTVHEEWIVDCDLTAMQSDKRRSEAKKLAEKDPTAAREKLRAPELPPEPVARRYLVNDSTIEKLGELLTKNPWGMLVYRDELHGLLCDMDRQGQEGSRSFYLSAYDGKHGHTVDRIGRGEVNIPRVCLSMLGGIQPGKVQSYVREAVAGGSADDGLLQRFGLAVWPDVSTSWTYIDRKPNIEARRLADAVFDRISKLQPGTDGNPSEWRFSPDAQNLYQSWIEKLEPEIRGDELHPALVSHLSKYRKLVPALALIFAMIDTPDSENVIQEAEFLRAISWAEYLRTHAERLYSAAVIPETAGAQALLAKIRAGKLADGFRLKDVQQKGWSGLATTEAVRKAVEILVDYDWLDRQEGRSRDALGRGRPSECYFINPLGLKNPA